MDLRLTKQQEQLLSQVRRFAQEELAPWVEVMEKRDLFPRPLIRRMGQLGFMGIPVPSRWGGRGADFISFVLTVHQLSKVSASVGVILSVHTSVGILPLLIHGSEKQKARYIPPLAAGRQLAAFALTEPQAGSDASGISTRAERNGDHYLLYGSKQFVTNGGEADLYITFARTKPGGGRRGISAFILERGADGLRIGRQERKMGLWGTSTTELILDGTQVPVENRLGPEGAGLSIALSQLDGGRIGIAAQSVGLAEAALEQALRAVADVEGIAGPAAGVHGDGGGALGRGGGGSLLDSALSCLTDQSLAHSLVQLAAEVEAARLLTYRAAQQYQEKGRCQQEAAMAKLYASDVAMKVTSRAIELAGEAAGLQSSPLQRFFRDAKVTQIYEGTNQIQRLVIAKKLLG